MRDDEKKEVQLFNKQDLTFIYDEIGDLFEENPKYKETEKAVKAAVFHILYKKYPLAYLAPFWIYFLRKYGFYGK